MDDLIAWFRGVLDEIERTATAATPGPWRGGDWTATWGTPEETVNAIEHAPGYGPFPALRHRDVESDLVLYVEDDGDERFAANLAHIARHDPASVLADIAAKRAVLDRFEQYARWAANDTAFEALKSAGEVLARLLASAYADRPGYRQEWRP